MSAAPNPPSPEYEPGRQLERDLIPHYDGNVEYGSPLDGVLASDLTKAVGFRLHAPILDLGCGIGKVGRQFQSLTLHGVDFSSERIKEALHRSQARPWQTFECADLWEWVRNAHHAGNAAWGTILLVDVLEHLHHPRALIDDIRTQIACENLIATVPLNFPNKAHLQVYGGMGVVVRNLSPDAAAGRRMGGHDYVVLGWSG